MEPIIHILESATARATRHSRFNTAIGVDRPTTGVVRNGLCRNVRLGWSGMGDSSPLREGRWAVWSSFFWVSALFFLCALPVQAQRSTYPSAPVRVIVGFPPGGGVDVVTRLICQKMASVWGQPVVVENRPGASSSIATRFVAGAAPDGYTILINSNSMVINQVVTPNVGYDIERQLTPVLNVAWQPLVIVAASDLPVVSLRDVLSLSRTRKLSYGTPGPAGPSRMAGAYLFTMLSKADILHVSYKGAAPALSAVAGKEVELAIVTLPPAIPLITSGRVKAIAVTTAKRTSLLPNIPTVAESGFPGYDVNTFTGFFMPAGTPKAIVDKLNETVLKVLAMPDIREKLADLGYEPADTANENFPRIVSEEIQQWTKVIKETNIKIE
jgi:tripartite-type tricarboxylate transporter receptor subunit TctC